MVEQEHCADSSVGAVRLETMVGHCLIHFRSRCLLVAIAKHKSQNFAGRTISSFFIQFFANIIILFAIVYAKVSADEIIITFSTILWPLKPLWSSTSL
jgi:hypothetical protein